MDFEKKVSQLIEDIPVPRELRPENIAIMLKKATSSNNIKTPASPIKMKADPKIKVFRMTASIAACVALVFGITALFNEDSTSLPIGYLESGGEIKEAESYSDVYKVIQDVFVKNGTVFEDEDIPYAKPVKPILNPKEVPDPPKDATDADMNTIVEYSIASEQVEGVSQADILRTDGNNLYYIANNALYVVSADNGKMTLLSKTSKSEVFPIEMYIEGDRLTVISNEKLEIPYIAKDPAADTTPTDTATTDSTDTTDTVQPADTESSAISEPADSSVSDTESTAETTAATGTASPHTTVPLEELSVPTSITQTNVVVEVYDISDKVNPKVVTTYKQNGSYVSSKVINNSLYIVSNYARYQTKPLQHSEDLENYVPAYYVNDTKTFIEAKDICLPPKVATTSYSIVAGLNIHNENPLVSIKAVLGNCKSIYALQDLLYLVGNGEPIKNKDNSSITSFKLDNGSITYSANAIVEGSLISSSSMGQFDNSFRIATTTTDSKTEKIYSNIYILSNDLKPMGSISELNPDKKTESVRFNSDKAYLISGQSEPLIAVSLANKSSPSITTEEDRAALLHKYNDSNLLGLGLELDENGKEIGLKLSMFDITGSTELHSTSINGKISGIFSDEVLNRKALYIDSATNTIGVPTVSTGEYGTKNLYYLFTYDTEKGFIQKGTLEYTDIDAAFKFNRGEAIGDVFYALSNGRIVSAQSSDLKVIDILTLK